ncbi:hemin uptake protein HemP [Methylobacter sp. S3L5C]|uniref:hemin uptake protein HemP n=1 Tax=Methylobacter sp. S3L5C TaxID=2839024 RepID=UPI001FAD3506|nr:hemin uptake protein HemP [Methylobacter sp. S3L5C]UOA10050.1 hemin uptake protein HemP [Methylobacter sp. S3L5C]
MKIPVNDQVSDLIKSQDRREIAIAKPRFNCQQLFGTQNEIIIEHQSDDYRLRITSNGKLILTK